MPGPIKPAKHDHVARADGKNDHSARDVLRKHVDKQAAATDRPTRRGPGIARLLGARAKAASRRPDL